MKYSKTNASLLSFLLIILILYPVTENWKTEPEDNFPMSYYPMFSHKRKADYRLRHFVGYDRAENRYIIPYKYVGSGGLNQVRHQINRMCREGKEKKLIRKVVNRLEKSKSSPYNRITRVELVRATYNLEDYFLNNIKMPLKERLIASRTIKRD